MVDTAAAVRLEHLRELSGRARVTYALRCARRVEHLLRMTDPDAHCAWDLGMQMAVWWIEGRDSLDAAACRAAAVEVARAAGHRDGAVRLAAEAAWAAATCAACEGVAVLPAMGAATAAVRAAALTGDGVFLDRARAAEIAVTSAARADHRRLRRVSPGPGAGDPLDLAALGPLWPDDRAPWGRGEVVGSRV